MGAGSCRRATLMETPKGDGAAQLSDGRVTDGGGATDLRIDIGSRSDAPAYDVSFDIVFGLPPDGSAQRDAGSTEPHDAGCGDASCGGFPVDPATCRCVIVIA